MRHQQARGAGDSSLRPPCCGAVHDRATSLAVTIAATVNRHCGRHRLRKGTGWRHRYATGTTREKSMSPQGGGYLHGQGTSH